MQHWTSISPAEALQQLAVDQTVGLSTPEITRRTAEHGRNEYTKTKQDSIALMVLRQFKDVANIILLLAGGLSLALAIREGHGFIEPVVIFSIIIMNISLAVSQERSAEKALEALQHLNSPRCFVLREGVRIEIDTVQVVPGDILVLKTGDLVPADARLIESVDLAVDESSLTGESEPVEKDSRGLFEEDVMIGDMLNMVFSGCLITAGNALAVVTSTGMNTQMGKIAGYLNNVQKIQTPLQKRLNKVIHLISLVAIVSAVALLIVGLQQGEDFWTMMLAAVALAVAAVPETLQLIVTLTLTQGVKKMVEKSALIRKLPAVETLGNVSIICSDKTGTLTQNRMTIQQIWIPEHEIAHTKDELDQAQKEMLLHFALASNATVERTADGSEHIVGDATESAILRLMLAKGEDPEALRSTWERVGEVPFSSERKMMTVVYRCPQGGYLALCKGAFDRLPCASASDAEKAARLARHDAFAHDALRVIALASSRIESLPEDLASLEHDLTFEGIIGLIDPPRPEAAAAIKTARKAGVRTIMITGDHAGTAAAIARQIGLFDEEGQGHVVTGRELAHMSDEELIENIRDYSVYARVSPEDKIRIVEAWQEHGEVVSMTGDGVNDAPALKAADVGVAMGIAGTEVAKSAADMVLTDDNFATIVSSIREGRNVFSNIRKTIYFLLVCNLSEIVIMVAAQLLAWGMPLTPVMLLLINVLGDGIPGLHLAKERSDERIMQRKPIGRNESFFNLILVRAIILQTAAFSVVGLVAYYYGAFLAAAPSQSHGQTMAFLVVAITSILHIFTVRSRASLFRRTIKDNMPLLLSALAMIAAFVIATLIAPVGAIFDLVPLGPTEWLLVGGLCLVPTLVAELFKLWDNRHTARLYRNRLVHHTSPQDWQAED
ncbi:MAG: cation-translocating P-type ATPase [Coriobacteriales bacterium]|jgi:calcium-translocating P-type ATPase|nr:cation-translocating P-type ATPase [Coriobacteriales bacterium]